MARAGRSHPNRAVLVRVPAAPRAHQVAEADAAHPLEVARAATANLAFGWEDALPIAAAKVMPPLALVDEYAFAQPIVPVKRVLVGLADETTTALPPAAAKTLTAWQAAEADTAGLVRAKARVYQVEETSTALPLRGAKMRPIGWAGSTAQARPIRPIKKILLGHAVDSGAGQPVSGTKVRRVGQAVEAGAGLPVYPGPSAVVVVRQAVETSTTSPINRIWPVLRARRIRRGWSARLH